MEALGYQWFAVFTMPQNEKSVARHLDLREVETYLPTYEVERVWKNRQRVKVTLPLFPTYLFVRIDHGGRSRVLQTPGVLRIVGNSREPLPLPDSSIEFLRAYAHGKKIEPCWEPVAGDRVRIRSGVMKGVEGILVRKNNRSRFVLSLDQINQRAAIEVSADEVEPVGEQL